MQNFATSLISMQKIKNSCKKLRTHAKFYKLSKNWLAGHLIQNSHGINANFTSENLLALLEAENVTSKCWKRCWGAFRTECIGNSYEDIIRGIKPPGKSCKDLGAGSFKQNSLVIPAKKLEL